MGFFYYYKIHYYDNTHSHCYWAYISYNFDNFYPCPVCKKFGLKASETNKGIEQIPIPNIYPDYKIKPYYTYELFLRIG